MTLFSVVAMLGHLSFPLRPTLGYHDPTASCLKYRFIRMDHDDICKPNGCLVNNFSCFI